MKSKMNIKSIIMIAIIALPIMFFITIKSLAAETATVNVETANLRESANQDSKILEQLSIGEEVEILEKSEDWYKVKVRNITGYLRQDLINVKNQNEDTKTENVTVNTEGTTATNTEQTATNNIKQEETTPVSTENEQGENIAEQTVENNEEKIQLGKYKLAEEAKLKMVPLINGAETIDIQNGEEIEVTEIINGWICVETMSAKGWIREEKIKVEENKTEEQKQEPEEQNKTQEETPQEEPKEPEEPKTETKTLYVNASAVNVRKQASTSSEVVTNLQLNTAVVVLSEEGGWCKVQVNSVQGYIASSLLSETKQETSRSMETPRKENGTTTTTSETSSSNSEATGTSSSVSGTSSSASGTAGSSSTGSTTGASIVATAKSYIGTKYVYGGTSSSGFDCSGFTQYVYKQYGISLNRTAQAQYSNGTQVSRSELQLGDLIMFGPSASSINHVGIYIGGGQIVHAANASRGVTTDTITFGYYNTNYVGARRVL